MNIKSFLLALTIIISIAGCTEDQDTIGGSIRPPKDKINVSYVDSISFKAFSFKPTDFSLRTDGGIKDYESALLGGLKPDIPEVAGVKGDLALEFWYNELDITLSSPDSILVLDSVVLVLIQNGFYGDSAALHLFEVFELNKRLSASQNYFSDENPSDFYDQADKLGERQIQTIDYTIADSLRSETDYIHSISIPLDKSLGQRVLDNYDDIKDSYQSFRDLFNGVYVKTTFSTKAMMRVYPFLTTTNSSGLSYTDFSAINFIYHYNSWDTLVVENDTTTISDNDTIIGFLEDSEIRYHVQSVVSNNQCQRVNVLRKDYGTYNFDYNETTVQPEVLYMQGLNVAKVRLKFPSIYDKTAFAPLEGQDSARIAINSAKLVFNVEKSLQDLNENMSPVQLYLRRDTIGSDSIGNVTYTPDQSIYLLQGQSYTQGVRTTEYSYEFNIAEYIQELIDNKVDNPDDLILSVAENRTNPGFALIKGLTNADEKLKLEIIYTRY